LRFKNRPILEKKRLTLGHFSHTKLQNCFVLLLHAPKTATYFCCRGFRWTADWRAFCAALVLFALTFVPVSDPSSNGEKISPLHSISAGPNNGLLCASAATSRFKDFCIDSSSSFLAQELLRKIYVAVDLRRMPRDQAFSVLVDAQDRNVRAVEFVMQEHLVRVSDGLGGWSVEKQELAHVAGSNSVRVRVTDNFAQSAARAGISAAQIAELQRIFSAEVDLLADLGAGDEVLLVLPEKQYFDGHAVKVRCGDSSGACDVIRCLRFNVGGGVLQYYDADGHLLRERFWRAVEVRSDIVDIRISAARSGNRALRPHEAIDFQAPQGRR